MRTFELRVYTLRTREALNVTDILGVESTILLPAHSTKRP
jgi:hypothetical protein